ncbi:MAG: hypothetical protein WKF96_09150 [Solirubrobacteraceae bacterium]
MSPVRPSGRTAADVAEALFDHVGAVTAARSFELDLGGARVAARIVGERLAFDVARAFGSSAESPPPANAGQRPALHIDVWDEAATGVAWRSVGVESWQAREGPFGERIRMSPDRTIVSYEGNAWRALLIRDRGRLVAAVPSAERHPHAELARPLRLPLMTWLSDRRVEVVHGALISKDGQGVLCVGPENAGKSTVAMACVDGGYAFVGDDYIALCSSTSPPTGFGIYRTSALHAAGLSRYPRLRAAATPPPHGLAGKAHIWLGEVADIELAASTSIVALVVTRSGTRCSAGWRAVSGREALLALAPTSLLSRPLTAGKRGFELLGALVEQVPAYRLELGGDSQGSIISAVDEVLAAAGPGQ